MHRVIATEPESCAIEAAATASVWSSSTTSHWAHSPLELKRFARAWSERTWAVEEPAASGWALAPRIAADEERVLNVPAHLSARVRALGGGSGRKTDDTDAYAIAWPVCAATACRSSPLTTPAPC